MVSPGRASCGPPASYGPKSSKWSILSFPRRLRQPQDDSKTTPRRPKTPTRRSEHVFNSAQVPKNTIKPVVFYTFSQCATTPPRRTGDAPRRPQDPSRTPPKKNCSRLGGVLGRLRVSWGVLEPSWGRFGAVLGALFLRLGDVFSLGSILGSFWTPFWTILGSILGPIFDHFGVMKMMLMMMTMMMFMSDVTKP